MKPKKPDRPQDRAHLKGRTAGWSRLPFSLRIRKGRQGRLAEDQPVGIGDGPSLQNETTGDWDETQWRLIWRRFRKHRLAMSGLAVVLLFYFVALLAEFIAPFNPRLYDSEFPYAPPHRIRFIEETEDGARFNPHFLAFTVEVDAERYQRYFVPDEDKVVDLRLFVETEPYLLMNFIPMQRRLFGPVDRSEIFFLLGADRLGRDLFSRIVYGTRVSMTVGLVGVSLSLMLGVMLGGISGYFGGWVDNLIQRLIEFLQSIPSIPLWLGLSAAIPPNIHPLMVYFYITLILSVLGWTGLGRVVRGKFMSLKTEDFVVAARLDGCSSMRVIGRHMVPSFTSHIIATTTLAIPHMIIGETSLSFLGLGLRPPVISWGVLLQSAQNIRSVATAPWLLLPGLFVAAAVLALNFLGDGIRDAADPYA